MKRGDFIKEMGNSLFKTVKSVYEPFMQDDIEKVMEVTDVALGISWYPVMKKYEASSQLEVKYVEGKPIIVWIQDTNMQAKNGICPVCSNIINVTALYSTGKCWKCEKEYNFKTQQGELELESIPIKLKDETYYVGLQRHKK